MTSGSCVHHTVKVTDTPATYSFGHVVGLTALDMVQPWAKLDVARVGLSFAHWMAVISPAALLLDLLYSVLRSRVSCVALRACLPACGSALDWPLRLDVRWVNLLSLTFPHTIPPLRSCLTDACHFSNATSQID